MGLFRILVGIILFGLLFLIGCSSGEYPPVIPVDENLKAAASPGSHSCWGLWQFRIDPDAGKLDLVQLRSTDIHLNALRFLEPPPYGYLNVANVHFSGNVIDCDVSLRHPFLGLAQYTGFDVCGIFITSGSVTGFSDPDLRVPGEGDTRLLNADGFARWWNPAEFPHNDTISGYKDGLLGTPDSVADFSATLNPYKFFCNDIATPDAPLNSIDPSSRCIFSAGLENVRHYKIKYSPTGLIFNYAVDANWKFPSGSPPWDVPDDFPPGANRIEAWNASITEIENTLWNDGTSNGGTLKLSIDLWDHYNAGSNTLYIESPGNFPPAGPLTPTGSGTGYSTYEIDIASATPAENSIDILIIADSEKQDYQGLLPGKTIAAYFPYTAKVSGEHAEYPIAGDLSFHWECPGNPCVGHLVTFEISEAYDPGGANVTITWDFDGNFDYNDDLDGDNTNLTGQYIFSTPGPYEAWCRVDNGTLHTDAGPLAVTAIECIPDDPVLIKTMIFDESGTGYNAAYNDNGYVYIVYSDGGGDGKPNGLYIFDVDPVEQTHQVGYVETSHLPNAVAYKDGYCYIGGVYLLGVQTVDVDPPDTASVVDTDDAVIDNGFLNEMVIYGNYLYVAAQWGALMIYDISNPANPVFQGKVGPTPNHEYCASVDVSPEKGYAFITWGYEVNPEMKDYMHVVDISNPANPQIVHSIDMPHNPANLVVDGDWVYVLESSYLHVVNIENPLTAYEVTSISVASGLQDIWVDENYAYLVNFKTSPWTGNFTVVNITDPTAPGIVTGIPLTSIGMGVTAHCDIAYCSTGSHWEGSVLIPGTLDIVKLY